MARQIFANQATAAKRRVYFHLVDATDGITPETGEAGGQPQVSSDGAAFTNTGIGVLVHDAGNGRYYAELTQTLVATAGVIIETRYKSAETAEAVGDQVHVVGFDPDVANALVDVIAISGDTAAADNVEAMYDGTGYVAETAPATQLDGQNIKHLIESQRAAWTHQGDIYYVDPINGNDAWAGTSPNTAFETLTAAITAATDSNHDVIHLLAGFGAGVTESVTTATITVNKRYLLIRGPGGDFRFRRSTNGDVFNVTADGVELSGFRVQTAATGTGRGIDVSGVEFVGVKEVWVDGSQGDGLRLLNTSFCHIEECKLFDAGGGGAGNGIAVDATGSGGVNNHLRDNFIQGTPGNGIDLTGANLNNTVIRGENVVVGSMGYDIDVNAGVSNTQIGGRAMLSGEGSGAVNDSGTGTVDHRATTGKITEAVWLELLNQAKYSTNHMAAKYLKNTAQSNVIHDGTAQAGTTQTVTLAAGASAVDGFYEQMRLSIVGGTGEGQSAMVYSYDGATKIAKTVPEFSTAPDATSDYILTPALVHAESGANSLHEGYTQAGTGDSATLASDASAVDGFYVGQIFLVHHDGAAEGQSARITAYDGTTKIAALHKALDVDTGADAQYTIMNGYTATAAIAGLRSIVLHTQETDTTTVGQVAVSIKNAADDELITQGITGVSDGDLAVALKDGTYSVHVLKTNYTATSPQTVAVAADATHDLTINPIAIGAPSDPSLCRIFGRITNSAGTAVEGVAVRSEAVTPGVAQGIQLHDQATRTTTDASGDFTLDLVRDAVVAFTVDHAGYGTKAFTVPDTGTQDLAEWTPN